LIIHTKTAEDIRELRDKIHVLKLQLLQWQAITVRRLANEVVLDLIHNRMRRNGISEKIIQGTIVSNIEIKSQDTVRIFFKSEYFAETGYDVALRREKGSRRHRVAPRTKKSLHWIMNGRNRFSKGHWVDGVLPLSTIETALKELTPHLQDSYILELREWIEKNLKGVNIAV
jgi:hypothetical protein